MPTITIRGLPQELLEQLRKRAREDHRSLNREALHLLEQALQAPPHGAPEEKRGRLPGGEDADVLAALRRHREGLGVHITDQGLRAAREEDRP
jgi:plasmid stability protein